MKKQLANNALFGLMEKGVSIITVLLLTPYFISILGDDNYGLWILILSVISWFNFVDMGFSATIQRKIAIAIENNNLNKINRFFGSVFVTQKTNKKHEQQQNKNLLFHNNVSKLIKYNILKDK